MRNDGITGQGGDREVDLIVAGAGAGGMMAALVAALEGLDVLLCETSDQVGGTAATSAGTLWIPGNTESRKAGYDDTAEKAALYLDALIPREAGRDLREAFLTTGPEAIDYLSARTDVQFLPCGRHPDYHDQLPGAAVTGRAIVPRPFDGRLLGRDFHRVRPPIPEFMLFGGMMVGKEDIPRLINRYRSAGNFAHSARIFLRYLADRLRYRRGTRIMMGNALVARLYYSLRKTKAEIAFRARIDSVVSEGGRVTGAVVCMDGRRVTVRARRGVVLATGGYGHDRLFREAFMINPTPPYSLASEHCRGDGMRIGKETGARIRPEEHGSGGFWAPVSLTRTPDGRTGGIFPHLALDRAKPGLIAVNSAGWRFVNEASSCPSSEHLALMAA